MTRRFVLWSRLARRTPVSEGFCSKRLKDNPSEMLTDNKKRSTNVLNAMTSSLWSTLGICNGTLIRNDGCFPELKAKISLQKRNKMPNLVSGSGSCHSQQALKYLCRFQKRGRGRTKSHHALTTSQVAFDSPDRVKKKRGRYHICECCRWQAAAPHRRTWQETSSPCYANKTTSQRGNKCATETEESAGSQL